MKKSWENPVYSVSNGHFQAEITNSVEYGVASNYGHYQQVGLYVPAINAKLVHEYVPGTYALEKSLQEAELNFESVIRPEILRVWDEVRTDYYDRKDAEKK